MMSATGMYEVTDKELRKSVGLSVPLKWGIWTQKIIACLRKCEWERGCWCNTDSLKLFAINFLLVDTSSCLIVL